MNRNCADGLTNHFLFATVCPDEIVGRIVTHAGTTGMLLHTERDRQTVHTQSRADDDDDDADADADAPQLLRKQRKGSNEANIYCQMEVGALASLSLSQKLRN